MRKRAICPILLIAVMIFAADHVVSYQKDGGYHDFNAVREYLYNALPVFSDSVNE